jgi:hypothetical protein
MIMYLDSDNIISTDYKDNVKRSQFLLSILHNKIIQKESAYLKILRINTYLKTIYLNKWLASKR